MKALKQTAKAHGPLRLYHILGGSFTFLCGLRDLSGLFVGGRKVERKKAELWKNSLGPKNGRPISLPAWNSIWRRSKENGFRRRLETASDAGEKRRLDDAVR